MCPGHKPEDAEPMPLLACNRLQMSLRPLPLSIRQSGPSVLLQPPADVSPDPAVEQQAVARVHRIGQQRPVHVTRLLCSGTIEMAVLEASGRVAALRAAGMRGSVLGLWLP